MISIIITTYNAATFIVETLDSIRHQTYQQLEIVIVDDGSADQTLHIIREYIINYSSLRLIFFAMHHMGRPAALNYAISKASYDWIAIIDADDVWHTRKLELQLLYANKHHLDFLATKAKLFYKTEAVDIYEDLASDEEQIAVNQISFNSMLCSNAISHSSVLAKKCLLTYDLTRKSQIDYEMWLRLMQAGKKLYILNLNLVYHRIHSGQSFEAKNQLRYATKTTLLQLTYSTYNLKLNQTLFIFIKIGYYLFLPKYLRLKLRQILSSMLQGFKSICHMK